MEVEEELLKESGFCEVCAKQGQLRDSFAERLQEADEIIQRGIPNEVSWISGGLAGGEITFHYRELSLHLSFDRYAQPMVTQKVNNKSLPRKWVDGIRVNLRNRWIPELAKVTNIMDICMLVLRIVEHTNKCLDRYLHPTDEARQEKLRRLQEEAEWKDTVEVENVKDVISHFVGMTPKVLLDTVREKLHDQGNYFGLRRVVHCEVVARSDLTSRFISARQRMREKLMRMPISKLKECVPHGVLRGRGNDSLEEIVDYLCTPKLTYHGTQSSTVPSIVQHGFLVPGSTNPANGKIVDVRCGNSHGRGIYTSPDPLFSLSYVTPDNGTSTKSILGSKLIVCLTLMGRSATVTREDMLATDRQVFGDADSHVSYNQLEYVSFNNAHVLPCYVLHLDWGNSRTKEETANMISRAKLERYIQIRNERSDPRRIDAGDYAAGDIKRMKEERLAQARKFFAYGFGPVSGNKIIVEDIADVDDDEEDYGDYQDMRFKTKRNAKGVWYWGEGKALQVGYTEMDQYGDERFRASRNKMTSDM